MGVFTNSRRLPMLPDRPNQSVNIPILRHHEPMLGRWLPLLMGLLLLFTQGIASYLIVMAVGIDRWQEDIANTWTIQFDALQHPEQADALQEWLQKQPNVIAVNIVSQGTIQNLLKPWLDVSGIESIGLPGMVDVIFTPDAPKDPEKFMQHLQTVLPEASLETYASARASAIAALNASLLSFGGVIVLLLCVLCGAFAVVARMYYYMNRNVIEILVNIGASDDFVTMAFQQAFLRLLIKAWFIAIVLLVVVSWLCLKFLATPENLAPLRLGFGGQSGLMVISMVIALTWVALFVSRQTIRYSLKRQG